MEVNEVITELRNFSVSYKDFSVYQIFDRVVILTFNSDPEVEWLSTKIRLDLELDSSLRHRIEVLNRYNLIFPPLTGAKPTFAKISTSRFDVKSFEHLSQIKYILSINRGLIVLTWLAEPLNATITDYLIGRWL